MDEYIASRFSQDFQNERSRDTSLNWIEDVAANKVANWMELMQAYSILPTLMKELSVAKLRNNDARKILQILQNMSTDLINFPTIVNCTPSVFSALSNILISDDRKSKIIACEIIMNLSNFEEYRSYLLKEDLNVIGRLVNIISNQTDESRRYAFMILENLSSDDEIKVLLCEPSLGLLQVLSSLMVSDRGEACAAACSLLSYLSLLPQNHPHITAPELKLMESLVHVMRDFTDSGLVFACTVLGNLSSNDEYTLLMTDPALGLLDALVEVLTSGNGEASWRACTVIANLSVHDHNKRVMAHPDLGLVQALKAEAQINRDGEGEGRTNACATLAQIASLESTAPALLAANLWPLMIFLIESAGSPSTWSASPVGHAAMWAVQFLLNMAQWQVSWEPMAIYGVVQPLHSLLEHSHRHSLCALLALASLWAGLETAPPDSSGSGTGQEGSQSSLQNDLNTLRQAMDSANITKIVSILLYISANKGTSLYRHDFFRMSVVLRVTMRMGLVSNKTARSIASNRAGTACLNILTALNSNTLVEGELCCVDMALRLLYRLTSAHKKEENLMGVLFPDQPELGTDVLNQLQILRHRETPEGSPPLLTEEGRRCVHVLIRRLGASRSAADRSSQPQSVFQDDVGSDGEEEVTTEGNEEVSWREPTKGNRHRIDPERSPQDSQEGSMEWVRSDLDDDNVSQVSRSSRRPKSSRSKSRGKAKSRGRGAAGLEGQEGGREDSGQKSMKEKIAERLLSEDSELSQRLMSDVIREREQKQLQHEAGDRSRRAREQSNRPSKSPIQEAVAISASIGKKKGKTGGHITSSALDGEGRAEDDVSDLTQDAAGMISRSRMKGDLSSQENSEIIRALKEKLKARKSKSTSRDNLSDAQMQAQGETLRRRRRKSNNDGGGEYLDEDSQSVTTESNISLSDHSGRARSLMRSSRLAPEGPSRSDELLNAALDAQRRSASARPARGGYSADIAGYSFHPSSGSGGASPASGGVPRQNTKPIVLATTDESFHRRLNKKSSPSSVGEGAYRSRTGSMESFEDVDAHSMGSSSRSRNDGSVHSRSFYGRDFTEDAEQDLSDAMAMGAGGTSHSTRSRVGNHRDLYRSAHNQAPSPATVYGSGSTAVISKKQANALAIVQGLFGKGISNCLPLRQIDEQVDSCYAVSRKIPGYFSDISSSSASGYPSNILGMSEDVSESAMEAAANDQAWRMLKDTSKVRDLDYQAALMKELGISRAVELKYCSMKDLERLSDTLKDVPRRMFRDIYGL